MSSNASLRGYTSSCRPTQHPPRLCDELKQTSTKKPRSADSKSSIDLFQKCQTVLKRINSDRPRLSKVQCNSLKKLLDVDRTEWLKSNGKKNLEARSEVAMHLARHLSSLCRIDSHGLVKTAWRYHDIACENLGVGKYDVRADAFWNRGEFFEKPPTIEYLTLSAISFKTAAKATFFWSLETGDESVYTKAAEIYRSLEVKLRENGNISEAEKCIKQANKCDENALKNMSEKKELEMLNCLPIKKKTVKQRQADALYQESKEIYENLSSVNWKLEDHHVERIVKCLDQEKSKWLHTDQNKSKKYLRMRSELANLLANHYSTRLFSSEEIAVKYFQMALEKFSIGKYDVNGKAHRNNADFLKNRTYYKELFSETDVVNLEQAAKSYKIAAKATYHHSVETEFASSFSDAAMIYQRLADHFDSSVEKREHYLKQAVKCSRNALKISGKIDSETIDQFERGILNESQRNALNVLKRDLKLDTQAIFTQSSPCSSSESSQSTSSASSSTTRTRRLSLNISIVDPKVTIELNLEETRTKRSREKADTESDSDTDIEINSGSETEIDDEFVL